MVDSTADVEHSGVFSSAGESDIGQSRLARPVHDASDDGEGDRLGDMLESLLQKRYGLNDVESLPRTGWAGNNSHPASSQSERFENFESGPDLFDGIRGERHANCVADAFVQQHSDADGGFHGSGYRAAGFGDSEMKRAVNFFGEALVGLGCEEDIGRLDGDFELMEVVVL